MTSLAAPEWDIDEVLAGRVKRLEGYSYKAGGLAQYGLDVSFPEELDVDQSNMSIWVPYASGVARDGVGDLLEIGGIDFSRHRKNPFNLFDHGRQVSLPIAMSCPFDKEKNKYLHSQYTSRVDLEGKTADDQFWFYQGKGDDAVDRKDEYDHALLCEQLFDMAVKGLVIGGSIGYQVKRAVPLRADYERGLPQGAHLLEVLKLESSLVVMPANKDTVRKSFPDICRELCCGKACGKPLSPYLVKSLTPHASKKKAQMGYEAENVHRRYENPLSDQNVPPADWKPGAGAKARPSRVDRNGIPLKEGDTVSADGELGTVLSESRDLGTSIAVQMNKEAGHQKIGQRSIRFFAPRKLEKKSLGKSQIPGDLEFWDEEADEPEHENFTPSLMQVRMKYRKGAKGMGIKSDDLKGLKSLSLPDVRRKYRTTAKGLRRRVKSGRPGVSIMRVKAGDLGKAKAMAEAKGLKFERVGPEGPDEKVRLIGDAVADEVARHFGRPVVQTKSMKSIALHHGSYKVEETSPGVFQILSEGNAIEVVCDGVPTAEWNSRHDAEQALQAWVYQQSQESPEGMKPVVKNMKIKALMTKDAAQALGISESEFRNLARRVGARGRDTEHQGVMWDEKEIDKVNNLLLSQGRGHKGLNMQKKTKAHGDPLLGEEGETLGVEDGHTPGNEENHQKEYDPSKYEGELFSSQVLRKAHHDLGQHLAEHDGYMEHLEHEPTKKLMQKHLEAVDKAMTDIEEHHAEHHPDYPPIDGKGMDGEEGEEGSEETEANSGEENRPTPDEVVEGMETKGFPRGAIKAARIKARQKAGFGIEDGHEPNSEARKEEEEKRLKARKKSAEEEEKEKEKRLKAKKKAGEFPEADEQDAVEEIPHKSMPFGKHHVKTFQGAAKHLKDLSEAPMHDESSRMDSYHWHKALESALGEYGNQGAGHGFGVEDGHLPGVEENSERHERQEGKSGSDEIRGRNQGAQRRAMWAKDPEDPYKSIGKSGRKDGMDPVAAQDAAVEVQEGEHPHVEAATKAMHFLGKMAREKAFGDSHRAEADYHAKALGGVAEEMTQEDAAEVQHPDSNAEEHVPGDMGEKGFGEILKQRSQALKALDRTLNQLANRYAAVG